MRWTVERGGPVCTNIRIDYDRNKDWEQWGLLTADRHIDSPKSNESLQRYHLEQAKEREAFVLDFGDFFDAMQGKTDKRSAKMDINPKLIPKDGDEIRGYFNNVVKYGADFIRPYAQNFALIAEGNHESAIDKRLDFNLMDVLFGHLADMGSPCIRGGYRGWVRFFFSSDGMRRESKNAYYHHGSGGGGPVTKGVIQTNRRSSSVDGADYFISGHIHEQWLIHVPKVTLNMAGNEVIKDCVHIQLPTYKEEFADIGGGFHHEKGGPPKPLGAYWIRFYWSIRDRKIKAQFIEADA